MADPSTTLVEAALSRASMLRRAARDGPLLVDVLPSGKRVLYVCDVPLASEIFDEARFEKVIGMQLEPIRDFAGDGLFTARSDEPNWGIAHRVLRPSFAPGAVDAYLPAMADIAGQLVLKWERLNPGEPADVVPDFVRLTFDTICLSAFGHRANSFYRETPHPFAADVATALGACFARRRRPAQRQPPAAEVAAYRRAVSRMHEMVDALIVERRALGPPDGAPRDFLDNALYGVDPRSGRHLDDRNIRYQVITFLIAGHETTSTLLSFAVAMGLCNPEALALAAAEADAVLGGDIGALPTPAQLRELTWIEQFLEETLRLWPPVALLGRHARASTQLGGRWAVEPEDEIYALLPAIHRDPGVWGPHPDTFDPARFSPEAKAGRPAAAWKPFGTGERACLGRSFAMLEAKLAFARILQRFELSARPGWEFRVEETPTIKPADLHVTVRVRAPRPAVAVAAPVPVTSATPRLGGPVHGTPLVVGFGSNLGTAERHAQRIAERGRLAGWSARAVPLDSLVAALPTEGVVVVVCSSYNGLPPDNAMRYAEWLADAQAGTLDGVRYAVFGCGHRDWASTYQQVPIRLDRRMAELGGERLYPLGEGDAREDLDGAVDAWEAGLWTALADALGLPIATLPTVPIPALTVEVLAEPVPNPFVRAFDARAMQVLANRELQRRTGPDASPRSTRLVELSIPRGIDWRAGDHVGVIPVNSGDLIRRVLDRFGVARDALVRVSGSPIGGATLPAGPISAALLLTQYVELHERATRPHVRTLAEHTPCPRSRRQLELLVEENAEGSARYQAWITEPHRTVLDLLEETPACVLPFGAFLAMLPPLRPRYYSASSAPAADPRTVALTVSVVDAPARSGRGTWRGTCSRYLAEQPEGSYLHAFIRPSSTLRLPDDPEVPLVCVGAGSGIAPFRGFFQERALARAGGLVTGPVLLLYGCRRPDHDLLYAEELQAGVAQGLLELVTAFSHLPGQPPVFVQHQVRAHGDRIWARIEAGAYVFVSGDGARMAPAVREAFITLASERLGGRAAGETWMADMTAARRYAEDVFGSPV